MLAEPGGAGPGGAVLRGINPWRVDAAGEWDRSLRVDAAGELRGIDPVLSGAVVGSIPGVWTQPASGIDPWRVDVAGELHGIDPVLRVGEVDDDGFKVQIALSICFRQFARESEDIYGIVCILAS